MPTNSATRAPTADRQSFIPNSDTPAHHTFEATRLWFEANGKRFQEALAAGDRTAARDILQAEAKYLHISLTDDDSEDDDE